MCTFSAPLKWLGRKAKYIWPAERGGWGGASTGQLASSQASHSPAKLLCCRSPVSQLYHGVNNAHFKGLVWINWDVYMVLQHAWVIVTFGGKADITIIITETRSHEERQAKEMKMSEQKIDKILRRQDPEFSILEELTWDSSWWTYYGSYKVKGSAPV